MEALQEILGGLLRERERLRLAGAQSLEANRLAIVHAQQELAHAFVVRYGPAA